MNDHLLQLESGRKILLRASDETPLCEDESGRRLWWFGTPPVNGIPSPLDFRERIDTGRLTDFCPPWVAVLRGVDREPSFLATDAIGLQHFYYRDLPGIKVFSPSAIELASLAPFKLDFQAGFELLTVGNPQGNRTLFEQVGTVGGATLLEFACDGSASSTYWRPPELREAEPEEAVLLYARAVRQAVEKEFEAGGVQELTAGKDSMLLLAAARSCGLEQRFWTMGLKGDSDMIGARRRARRYGLEHQAVSLEGLWDEEPGSHREMARRFLLASNGMLNVFQYSFLPWVLERVDGTASVSGGGGEILRGFFYEWGDLLPGGGTWNDRLLLHGKVRFDMPFDHPVLRSESARDAHGHLAQEIAAQLGRHQSRRHGLDCYYATDRMHHFGGATVSATGQWKPVRSPLLSEGVLECLGLVPLDLRAGSRLVTRAIDHLLKESPGGGDERSSASAASSHRLWTMAGKLRQRVRDRQGSSFDELRSLVLKAVVGADSSLLDPEAMISGDFYDRRRLQELVRTTDRRSVWPKVLGGIATIEWTARQARRLSQQAERKGSTSQTRADRLAMVGHEV